MTPLPSVDGDGNSTVQLPVKFAADTVMDVVPENGLILTVAIVMAISAVLSIIATASKGNQSEKSSFWFDIFATTPIWIVVRIVGAIFGFMAYFGFGPEFIVSGDTGSLLLAELLPFLFTIFLFAGLLLPLLLNFGLMEFFWLTLKKHYASVIPFTRACID